LYEQSLALYRELGDKRGIASCLLMLGDTPYRQCEYGRAAAMYEEGLALCRQLGSTFGIAAALVGLGAVAYHHGNLGKSTALLAEAISLSRETGWGRPMAGALEILSWLALTGGEAPRATLIGGFSEALREARSVPVETILQADHDRAVQAMREAVGEEEFAAVWAKGRVLPLEEAIALALGG
jgi:tetratricopeptide (TPR) repeat protein